MLRIHLKFAAGEEQNSVEVVKVLGIELQFLFGQRFRIGSDCGVPEPGILTQALNRGHSVGNGFVPISLFLTDDQQLFFLHLYRRLCLASTHSTSNYENQSTPTHDSHTQQSSTAPSQPR